MIDHYNVLGLTRNATKDEIKEAFRKLAVKFHPDKHFQSPKSVRDDATLKFKQVSEAYEVLSDDRKRADYNLRFGSRAGFSGAAGYGYGYGYRGSGGYYGDNAYKYRYGPGSGNSEGFASKFENVLRFMTTRAFLLNLAFAGVLLGGSVFIDSSGEALWKMRNSGKSFEDALESINKAKTNKDKA